eukprot:938342-Prorocentrum_minimum.AAC.7
MEWCSDNVWYADAVLPTDEHVEYKFVVVQNDGNVIWQEGPDKTMGPDRQVTDETPSGPDAHPPSATHLEKMALVSFTFRRVPRLAGVYTRCLPLHSNVALVGDG